MKANFKITVLCFLFFLMNSVEGYAQTLGFNYQAIVKPQTNETIDFYGETIELNFLVSSELSVRFSIIRNGESMYTEEHDTQTNQYGEINLNIGSGQVSSGTFSEIPWDGNPMQLSVEIDFLDGEGFQYSNTQELLYLPHPTNPVDSSFISALSDTISAQASIVASNTNNIAANTNDVAELTATAQAINSNIAANTNAIQVLASAGVEGPQGVQGIQGEPGPAGADGAQGIQG